MSRRRSSSRVRSSCSSARRRCSAAPLADIVRAHAASGNGVRGPPSTSISGLGRTSARPRRGRLGVAVAVTGSASRRGQRNCTSAAPGSPSQATEQSADRHRQFVDSAVRWRSSGRGWPPDASTTSPLHGSKMPRARVTNIDEGLLTCQRIVEPAQRFRRPRRDGARWRTSVWTFTMNIAAGMPLPDTSPTRNASRPSASRKEVVEIAGNVLGGLKVGEQLPAGPGRQP